MLNNNASKIYQRLDNVLKKDKAQNAGKFLSENVKLDIEKSLSAYLEIKPSTSNLKVQTSNNEIVLSYTVSVKRIKEFIYY